MAVKHDYNCQDCDEIFEAWSDGPSCPACSSLNLTIVFLKPPGYKSVQTKNADDIFEDLIASHGMTDYQNDPSRTHEKSHDNVIMQSFDPKKDLQTQVMEGLMKYKHPNTPHVPNPSTLVPLDPGSGDLFRRVRGQSSNYRMRATEVVARVDKDGV